VPHPDSGQRAAGTACLSGRLGAIFKSCRTGARRRGFEVIDLDVPMSAYNQSTGKTLDFPFDDHWNAEAHGLIAEAVTKTAAYRALVGEAARRRQSSAD
jgi:hypothetical protein